MIDELPINVVEDANGNKYYLDYVLGRGGQGMVCRTKDETLAVKFLMHNNSIVDDSKIYDAYQSKINDVIIMSFDNDIRLCKPEIMLKKPMCGYVMKLLSDLKPINALIYDPNSDCGLKDFFLKTQGLKKRVEVLLELARSLARLHSKGIVYCDISPNNVFYSETTNFSNVWLIDCDNLRFVGDVKKGIFTPGYGAPEIVSNITSNTIYSDCFSFAILAFKVLTNRNPFEQDYNSSESDEDGWDASNTEPKTFTNNSVFWLFENGISDDLRDYFKHFLDKDVLELFELTFNSQGRLEPSSRPSMRNWYEALKTTLTRVYKCQCNEYIFASEDECPFCKAKRRFSHYMYIDNVYKKTDYSNVVDSIVEEVKKDGFNDFDFSENTINEIKKDHYEKKYVNPLIVYDGLKLYNFNLFDITIYDSPYCILEFKYTNNSLFITSKYNKFITIRYQGEAQKLMAGGVHQLSVSDSLLIYLPDPVTGMVICVRVNSL